MGKFKLGKNVLDKKYGLLVINGNYYEETHKDGKPIFKLVNKTKIKKAERLSKEIAEKLKDSLDREKEHHCVDMKVGNCILPIVD